MVTLLACRACLITDVKMFSLKIPHLKNAYFKLTGVMDASSPSYVCYECANILLKSEQFRLKCAQANRVLTCMVLENSVITYDLIRTIDRNKYGLESKLAYSPNEQYYGGFEDPDIKTENVNNDSDHDNVDIKVEMLPITPDFHDKGYPENSKPTVCTKLKNKVTCTRNRKNKGKNEDDDKIKSMMILEKLDQEKAMLEVTNRRNSKNYRNSHFKCELCCRGFLSANTYNHHIKKHASKPGGFECDFCHAVFRAKNQICTHLHKYHMRKFKCQICPYVCFAKSEAKAHMSKHKGIKYPCDVCNEVFSYSSGLLKHKKRKHPTSCICDLCGSIFSNKRGVFMHKMLKHKQETNEKLGPECLDCGVHFASEKAWKRHLILSSNHVNILGCEECGELFDSDEQLKNHLHIHSEDQRNITFKTKREINCKVCDDVFRSYSAYHTHLASKHPEVKFTKKVKQFVCQICGKVFKTKLYMLSHIRAHDGEKPYQCTDCSKSYTTYSSLYVHQQTHKGLTFKCDLCTKVYNLKYMLKRHIKLKHIGIKPFKCAYCDKMFSERCEARYHAEYVHLKKPWPKRDRCKIKNRKLENIDLSI